MRALVALLLVLCAAVSHAAGGGEDVFTLVERAQQAADAKQYGTAAELYAAALQHPTARRQLSQLQTAQVKFNRGMALLHDGALEAAQGVFLEAATAEPKLEQAWVKAAWVAKQRGQLQQCAGYLSRAIAAAPVPRPETLGYFAEALNALKRFEDAAGQYERAVGLLLGRLQSEGHKVAPLPPAVASLVAAAGRRASSSSKGAVDAFSASLAVPARAPAAARTALADAYNGLGMALYNARNTSLSTAAYLLGASVAEDATPFVSALLSGYAELALWDGWDAATGSSAAAGEAAVGAASNASTPAGGGYRKKGKGRDGATQVASTAASASFKGTNLVPQLRAAARAAASSGNYEVLSPYSALFHDLSGLVAASGLHSDATRRALATPWSAQVVAAMRKGAAPAERGAAVASKHGRQTSNDTAMSIDAGGAAFHLPEDNDASPHGAPTTSSRRLGLGFLSRRFKAYPGMYLMQGLFPRFPRRRVAVSCFASGADDGSAERARLASDCDAFVDASAPPLGGDPQAFRDAALPAAAAKAGPLHVLVDYDGAHDANNLGTLALRPSAVQATWLGFAATSGLGPRGGEPLANATTLDYLIADPVVAPPEAVTTGSFSESLWYLPSSYQPQDPDQQLELPSGLGGGREHGPSPIDVIRFTEGLLPLPPLPPSPKPSGPAKRVSSASLKAARAAAALQPNDDGIIWVTDVDDEELRVNEDGDVVDVKKEEEEGGGGVIKGGTCGREPSPPPPRRSRQLAEEEEDEGEDSGTAEATATAVIPGASAPLKLLRAVQEYEGGPISLGPVPAKPDSLVPATLPGEAPPPSPPGQRRFSSSSATDAPFVFACFNRWGKLDPRTWEAWMQLLARVPGSLLWLYGGSEASTNASTPAPLHIAHLRAEAAARGIHPDRLVFAAKAPRPRHLARQLAADLALDTLLYGAHTTSSDALFTGTPLLTLPGTGFASRVGASLLASAAFASPGVAAGGAAAPPMHPPLVGVTASLQEYINTGVALGSSRAATAALRLGLLHGVHTQCIAQRAEGCRATLAPVLRAVEAGLCAVRHGGPALPAPQQPQLDGEAAPGRVHPLQARFPLLPTAPPPRHPALFDATGFALGLARGGRVAWEARALQAAGGAATTLDKASRVSAANSTALACPACLHPPLPLTPWHLVVSPTSPSAALAPEAPAF